MSDGSRDRAPGPLLLPWLAAVGGALALLFPLMQAWRSDSNLGHGWLAPLLAGYLWWERWSERPAALDRPLRTVAWSAAAAAFGLALFPVRLLLTPYPLWPAALALHTLAIVAAALALASLVAGRAGVRWFAAPLIVLPAALPLPTVVDLTLITPLRESMAALAGEICNFLGRPAIAVGTSIKLGTGWVGVDEACGGIRSLQGCVLLALFFGEWLRFPFARRALLVFAAAGAAIAGNFGRVLFLALQGSAHSIERAHDLAGWAAFAFSVVATLWLALHWAGYRLPSVAPAQPRAAAPAARPAWSVAVTLAVMLLAGETATRAWFASASYPGFGREGWTVQFPTQRLSFQHEPLSDIARDVLRPDTFAAGHWRTGRDEIIAAYYIEWHRGQTARFIPFVHNPTVCLPLAGCEWQEELPVLTLSHGNDRIPFRLLRFRRIGQDLLVAFTVWDPLDRKSLERDSKRYDVIDWTISAWADVRERKQHQSAQMLTVAVPWSGSAVAQLSDLLDHLVIPRTPINPGDQ